MQSEEAIITAVIFRKVLNTIRDLRFLRFLIEKTNGELELCRLFRDSLQTLRVIQIIPTSPMCCLISPIFNSG